MKQKLITIFLVLVILAGLSLLLYPTISDYVNSLAFRHTIEEYTKTVEEMDEDTAAKILEEARAYNAARSAMTSYPTKLNDEQRAVYNATLDITGTGIMGYVEIPTIGLSLPIYHGTEEAVLQSGVGHLEGSSLPVGGESTHAVLAGHTGLPSSELFTRISKLKEGDIFYIRVLNETLAYEVDQKTVLEANDPNLIEPLRIEEGMDYCTLQTCTPYGVNTHRLFVRGHRIIPPPPHEELNPGTILTGLLGVNHNFDPLLLIPVAIAILFIVGVLLLSLHYRKRRKAEAAENGGETDAEKEKEKKKKKEKLRKKGIEAPPIPLPPQKRPPVKDGQTGLREEDGEPAEEGDAPEEKDES